MLSYVLLKIGIWQMFYSFE